MEIDRRAGSWQVLSRSQTQRRGLEVSQSIALCRAAKDAQIKRQNPEWHHAAGRNCGWIDKGDCTYFNATS